MYWREKKNELLYDTKYSQSALTKKHLRAIVKIYL